MKHDINILTLARDGEEDYFNTYPQSRSLKDYQFTPEQLRSTNGPQFKDTALHLAAQNQYVNLIRIFIEQNADLEAKNSLGETPLHVAAFCGRTESVRELLAAGADRDAKDDKGQTVIELAMSSGVCGDETKAELEGILTKYAGFS